MKARFTFLLFGFLFSLSLFAQDGYEIKVKIKDYDQTKIVLGFHYNGKHLVRDTTEINKDGTFVFSGEEALKPGVYVVILPPENVFFEMLVDQKEQHFSVETSATNPAESVAFQNSTNNEVFSDYLKYLRDKNKEATEIQKTKATVGEAVINKKIADLGVSIREYQQNAVTENQGLLVAAIMKGAMDMKFPEFSGTAEQVQQQRFDYYKSHYFDNVDLADPRLIRSPLLYAKVDKYFEQLVYRTPDSINLEIDYVLSKAKANPETFKYWVTRFLNKYADLSTQYVGFDAIYVHVALTYYCGEDSMVDWIDEDTRKEICKDAAKYKAILIGTPAPKVKFKDQNDQWLDLYSVEAEFTIVYFYKPNCSFCEASIPKANAFFKERKDQGIKIISVCNKRGEDVPKCWETVKSMEIEDWINVSDPYAQGLSKFKVESFPTIFVLDKDKKIIAKGIGSEQLPEIINIYNQ